LGHHTQPDHHTDVVARLFPPAQLFDLGFSDFAKSPLCDIQTVNNDEALVDIFYAVTGFVDACELPPAHIVKLPAYMTFLRSVLSQFLRLPDFDAHRFVWLAEMINTLLHTDNRSFSSTCESVLREYFENLEDRGPPPQAHQALCHIDIAIAFTSLSTRGWIDQFYSDVILEQHFFLRKYIFASFATIDWTIASPTVTDGFTAWRLWMTRLRQRLDERPELPASLLAGAVLDSFGLFADYYATVTPCLARASAFRTELLAEVALAGEVWPGEMPQEVLDKAHFLLWLAAASGAWQSQLWLGLELGGNLDELRAIAVNLRAKFYEPGLVHD
jgi:hypothetical protein